MNIMELKVNESKVLQRTVEGVTYERYAIPTRFVNIGDDYIEFMREFAAPHMQEGDFLSISEKIIALCQERIVYRKDIHPSSTLGCRTVWLKNICWEEEPIIEDHSPTAIIDNISQLPDIITGIGSKEP